MIAMADELTRPPASGPGSGADAWRAYAAAVTDSPLESWAEMSRDDIIALLDSDDVQSDGPAGDDGALTESEREADRQADLARAALDARPRPRPVWMVPTGDGWVPEIGQR